MRSQALKRELRPYLLPAVLLYTVLFVLPAVFGAGVSLFDWSGLGTPAHYVGLGNYIRVFSDSTFYQSFINTLILTVVAGVLIFLVAFCSMVVLRQMQGRGFLRAVVYLPNIISSIAIGAALSFALDSHGMVNKLLGILGLPQPTWLGPDMVFKCIIAGVVWASSGFYVVLLMAAVDAIPGELYEAASLEGATKVQAFRLITLPLSWEVFATCAVLWVLASLKIFDIVVAFTGPMNSTVPPNARTVAVEQYLLFNDPSGLPQLGMVSALGLLMVILSVVLVLFVRRITKRESVRA